MEKILETKNLKKSCEKKKVSDIGSLDTQEGTIYSLIGKNGAGKSTPMKLVLGLMKKGEGVIKVFDQEVGPENQGDLNKNLGALIEDPFFHDHPTSYENLGIIRQLKGIPKEETSKTLNLVGPKSLGKRKARECSLDMKQGLGIAMVLIGNPKLLALNEPINGLNPQGIEEMRSSFKDIVKSTLANIPISSHILDEIGKISSHIGILRDGKLTYNGSLEGYRRFHPPFIPLMTLGNERTLDLLDLPEDRTRGEKVILGKMSNQEIVDMASSLHGKLNIYRVEEERESLEKLFIQESRS